MQFQDHGTIIPVNINHPQTYENPRAHFVGARIAAQLYCPPATGYAEHIFVVVRNVLQVVQSNPHLRHAVRYSQTEEADTNPRPHLLTTLALPL